MEKNCVVKLRQKENARIARVYLRKTLKSFSGLKLLFGLLLCVIVCHCLIDLVKESILEAAVDVFDCVKSTIIQEMYHSMTILL